MFSRIFGNTAKSVLGNTAENTKPTGTEQTITKITPSSQSKIYFSTILEKTMNLSLISTEMNAMLFSPAIFSQDQIKGLNRICDKWYNNYLLLPVYKNINPAELNARSIENYIDSSTKLDHSNAISVNKDFYNSCIISAKVFHKDRIDFYDKYVSTSTELTEDEKKKYFLYLILYKMNDETNNISFKTNFSGKEITFKEDEIKMNGDTVLTTIQNAKKMGGGRRKTLLSHKRLFKKRTSTKKRKVVL